MSCTLGMLTVAAALASDTAATVPMGLVSTNLTAGTGTTYSLSTVSLPLLTPAALDGAMTGTFSGITAASLSNSSAGWTAGQLSSSSLPCLIQITSGSAKGRFFLISTSTANTADTLTISSEDASLVDLTTLGVATGESGDTYRIFLADTLLSTFGSPEDGGVAGGLAYTSADLVRIYTPSGWKSYFYNTTLGSWRRVGLNTNADAVAIRPDALVYYNRIAAEPLNVTLIGEVPAITRQALVDGSGMTLLSTWWPVPLTLAESGLADLPDWRKSNDYTQADLVRVLLSSGWRTYFHNGTRWVRFGLGTNSDSATLPVASGILIYRSSDTTIADGVVAQAAPYDL